jgi:hypothetical protein
MTTSSSIKVKARRLPGEWIVGSGEARLDDRRVAETEVPRRWVALMFWAVVAICVFPVVSYAPIVFKVDPTGYV